ncbi:MAG TPA: LysR family transcriptional regulator [Stackebrandtia sp.]|jgi:DNA-binding transcriptional LysR family regulator|uniref:LysR family transcriptional regulator n=1 Tax=Stackebrandtia sp. TaxID=2023065 RepID=UPI002D466E9B|nr:LysR family transcriptional regulator [Stackebrandtia sp.]HZE40155.1 LysR family transcriptional regulator [Stackebrandtia sp.]
MLSVNALRLLHVLRLRGTLTAAAEELRLSRSAASHQLATLQRAVGSPLTEKVGRGLRLTESGELLAVHAARVLRELEEAETAVEGLRRAPTGTVRLGAIQTIPAALLPRLLTTVRRRHPGLRLETITMTTDEGLLSLSAGHLDIAIVQSYDARPLRLEPGIRAEVLFHDPVNLLLPAAHELAAADGPVAIAALERHGWIAGTPSSYFGQLVPSLCRRAGFTPDIVHRSDDFNVVASLVAAGQGVALIPRSAATAAWDGIAAKAIDDDSGRDVVAALRAGSVARPAIRAVLAALRRAASDA